MKSYTLEQLAERLDREASVAPGPMIGGARPVEYAGPEDITYVASEGFLPKLRESSAGAALVAPGLDVGDLPHIRSANAEADFARLTAVFYPHSREEEGISPRAEVGSDVSMGRNVSVGPFSVVGRRSVIGDRCVIGAHVVIGEDVEIGPDSRIFPNVTIYPRVRLGNRVIIHSGTVIGSDGFGYARDADAQGLPVAVKKYHSGTVEIEDDVEIGALCTVDRALAGTTRIGKGVKIDNLVQIAHNVQIGQGTVIAAQVGIAGSSAVGRFCMIAGQVGVKDHVTVGDGVVLATRVGIYRNVPDGAVMGGSVPAMPYNVFLRAQSLFKRLPEILERVRKLERAVPGNRKVEE